MGDVPLAQGSRRDCQKVTHSAGVTRQLDADRGRYGAKNMLDAVSAINAPRRTAEYNGQWAIGGLRSKVS